MDFFDLGFLGFFGGEGLRLRVEEWVGLVVVFFFFDIVGDEQRRRTRRRRGGEEDLRENKQRCGFFYFRRSNYLWIFLLSK